VKRPRVLSRGEQLGLATKVLILTTFDADDYVYEALRAGVSGFLLKDAPAEQLIVAVRSVAAGTRSSTRSSPGGSSRGSRWRPSRLAPAASRRRCPR
jgi:DNA-binding NarL/FixJ family response regulator